MSTTVKNALIAAVIAVVGIVSCTALRAEPVCVQSVKELVKESADELPEVKVEVYKGAEAARIIAIAKEQSGRDVGASDTVTVLTAQGNALILVSEGDCSKLGGRMTEDAVRAILRAAKVGSTT